MAEYINKKEAIKVVFGCKRYTGIDEAPYDYAENLINEMLTIDIVRCKECKHIDRTICLTSFPEKYGCKLGNGAHRLDFFCSCGERRTDD